MIEPPLAGPQRLLFLSTISEPSFQGSSGRAPPMNLSAVVAEIMVRWALSHARASPPLTDVTTFRGAPGHRSRVANGGHRTAAIGGRTGRGEPSWTPCPSRSAPRSIHLHAADAIFDGMGVIVAEVSGMASRSSKNAGICRSESADLLIVIRRHQSSRDSGCQELGRLVQFACVEADYICPRHAALPKGRTRCHARSSSAANL